MSYYIGVDIGTTGTKSVVFNKQGTVIASSHYEYPLYSDTPVMAEQDPLEIFGAVISTLRNSMGKANLAASDIQLVSFSAAMHSLIAVDAQGNPLTRAITWADQRAHPYAMALRDTDQGQGIYQRTGTPIHPMSPLTKLLWLKAEQPALFASAHKFIGIKAFVFHKLFGEYLVDHSLASATGMFNLRERHWDQECLALTGIRAEQLPTPVPSTHVLRHLNPHYAKDMGLSPDTPFVIGSSDGCLSNLGVGAIEPGVVAITIGTSAAIRTVTTEPVVDAQGRVFCYILDDKHYVVGGPINNGGIILRWVRDELCSSVVQTARRLDTDPYNLMSDIAAGVAPGSDGLMMLPFLAGERAPLWDANARGSYVGLGLNHRKEHMIRAAFEGVLFNIKSVMNVIETISGKPTKVQATGGFARSAMWRQLMADILDKDIAVPASIESSCLGAVILGMYALGEINDYSYVSDMVGATHAHTPTPENQILYDQLFSLYSDVSESLRIHYEKIAAFQLTYSGKV